MESGSESSLSDLFLIVPVAIPLCAALLKALAKVFGDRIALFNCLFNLSIGEVLPTSCMAGVVDSLSLLLPVVVELERQEGLTSFEIFSTESKLCLSPSSFLFPA